MSQYLINMKGLIREAFGYQAVKLYNVPPAQAEDDFYGNGLLGLPVFSNVIIPDGSYQEGASVIEYKGIELIDPIVEIALPKNVVISKIQGRRGTVKEYIGHDDYAISIRGILASNPTSPDARRYPTDLVNRLRELVELPVALPVTGRLFQLFKIKNIVIQDAAWPGVVGFTNMQAFELRCYSDEPIELQLI